MKALQVVQAVNGKKGQHVLAVWSREAKTVKGCAFSIVKRTAAWVRSGISYANLTSVKEGIQSGTREAVASLPWGQWREGFANYIIDHTPKGSTVPVEYVRLYPATFANLAKETRVEWMMDGVVATYAEVEPYLLASEKKKDDDKPVECFTLRAESIIEIAGE